MNKEISFKFEREQIVFNIGGEEYFIPRDQMLALINSAYIEDQFDRLVTPDDIFNDLDNFDAVANYLFWKGRGSTMEQIAESLVPAVSVKKLQNWVDRHAGYIAQVQRERAADLAAYLARLDATYASGRRSVKGA